MISNASKIIGGRKLRGLATYPPSEEFLTVDETGQLSTATASSPDLSPYVRGPNESIINRIARFSDSTGKLIASSLVEINDAGYLNVYNANGLKTCAYTDIYGRYNIEPDSGHTQVTGTSFYAFQIRRPGMSWFGLGDANGDTFAIGNVNSGQALLKIHQSTRKLTAFNDIEIENNVRYRNIAAGTIVEEVYNSGLSLWQEITRSETSTDGGKFSVLGAAPALRQLGGAATAGATYTTTEQNMIQKAYDTLRTFGFLT
jgi:hypothetical protein